jgi:hypothetical protein
MLKLRDELVDRANQRVPSSSTRSLWSAPSTHTARSNRGDAPATARICSGGAIESASRTPRSSARASSGICSVTGQRSRNSKWAGGNRRPTQDRRRCAAQHLTHPSSTVAAEGGLAPPSRAGKSIAAAGFTRARALAPPRAREQRSTASIQCFRGRGTPVRNPSAWSALFCKLKCSSA